MWWGEKKERLLCRKYLVNSHPFARWDISSYNGILSPLSLLVHLWRLKPCLTSEEGSISRSWIKATKPFQLKQAEAHSCGREAIWKRKSPQLKRIHQPILVHYGAEISPVVLGCFFPHPSSACLSQSFPQCERPVHFTGLLEGRWDFKYVIISCSST